MNEPTNIPLPSDTQEAGPLRLVATLGLAGFFAGLLLVTGFVYTLPMIEANKAESLRVAVYQVLKGCAGFDQLGWDGQKLTTQPGTGVELAPVYLGRDASGRVIGFAVTTEEPGFQDIIRAIYGYDPTTDQIIGMEILESKETPGLGDKIFKDDAFRANFTALAVQPEIVSVKKGEKARPNEVEAITGATISSKAVTRLLQKGMEAWRQPILDFQAQLDPQGENTKSQ